MKVRQNLYIDRDLNIALDALARGPGANKSRLVNDAVASWIARGASRELDDLLKIRLDRLSREVELVSRDLEVLLESLSLLVLHQLTSTALVPEADAAARAVGRARYEQFIAEVGRRVASAKRPLNARDEQH